MLTTAPQSSNQSQSVRNSYWAAMEALLHDIERLSHIGPQIVFAISANTDEGWLAFDEPRAEEFLRIYFMACLKRSEFSTEADDPGRILWISDMAEQFSFQYGNQDLDLSEERKAIILEEFRKYMGVYAAKWSQEVPVAVEVVRDNFSGIVDSDVAGKLKAD